MTFFQRIVALLVAFGLGTPPVSAAPGTPACLPSEVRALFLQTALGEREVVSPLDHDPQSPHLHHLRSGIFNQASAAGASSADSASTPNEKVPTARTIANRRIKTLAQAVSLAPAQVPEWQSYTRLDGPARNTSDPDATDEIRWLTETLASDPDSPSPWPLHLAYYPYATIQDSVNDQISWGFHYVNETTGQQIILGRTEIVDRYHLLTPAQQHELTQNFLADRQATNNLRWSVLRQLRATLQNPDHLELLLNRPEFDASVYPHRRLALLGLARLGTDSDPLHRIDIFNQVARMGDVSVQFTPDVIDDLYGAVHGLYGTLIPPPDLPQEHTLLQKLRIWIAGAVKRGQHGDPSGWDAISPTYSEQAPNLAAYTVKMAMLMRFIKFLKTYADAHDPKHHPHADAPRALLPHQIKRWGFMGSACAIEVRALSRLSGLLSQIGISFADSEFFNFDFSKGMLFEARKAVAKILEHMGIAADTFNIHYRQQDVVRDRLKQDNGAWIADHYLQVVETGIFGSLGNSEDNLRQKAFMLTEINRVLEKGGYMILTVKNNQIPTELSGTLKKFKFEVLSQRPDMGMSQALLEILAPGDPKTDPDVRAKRERVQQHVAGSGYLIAFKTDNLTTREADALPQDPAVREALKYEDVVQVKTKGPRKEKTVKAAPQTVPLDDLRYDQIPSIDDLPSDTDLDANSKTADAAPRMAAQAAEKKLFLKVLEEIQKLPVVGRNVKPMTLEALIQFAKAPETGQKICQPFGLQNQTTQIAKALRDKKLLNERSQGVAAKTVSAAPTEMPPWQKSLLTFARASSRQRSFAWPEWIAAEKELELAFTRMSPEVLAAQERAVASGSFKDVKRLLGTVNREYLARHGWAFIPETDSFLEFNTAQRMQIQIDHSSVILSVYETKKSSKSSGVAIRIPGAGIALNAIPMADELANVTDMPRIAKQILDHPEKSAQWGGNNPELTQRLAQELSAVAEKATGHHGAISTAEMMDPYFKAHIHQNLLLADLFSKSEENQPHPSRTDSVAGSLLYKSDDSNFENTFVKEESFAAGILKESVARPGHPVSENTRLEPADMLAALARLATLRNAENPHQLLLILEAAYFAPRLLRDVVVLNRADTLFFGLLAHAVAPHLTVASALITTEESMLDLSPILRAMSAAQLRDLADRIMEDNFKLKPSIENAVLSYIPTDPNRPAHLKTAALLRKSFNAGYVDADDLRALSKAMEPIWGPIPEELYKMPACIRHAHASPRENFYRLQDFSELLNRHYLRPHGIAIVVRANKNLAKEWSVVVGLIDATKVRDLPVEGMSQQVWITQINASLSWTEMPATYIAAEQMGAIDAPYMLYREESHKPELADPEPAIRRKGRIKATPRETIDAAVRAARASWKWGIRKYEQEKPAVEMLRDEQKSIPLQIAYAQAALLARRHYETETDPVVRQRWNSVALDVDSWSLPICDLYLRAGGPLSNEYTELTARLPQRGDPDLLLHITTMIGQVFVFLNGLANADHPSSILADHFFPITRGKIGDGNTAPGTLYLYALLLHRQTGRWYGFDEIKEMVQTDTHFVAVMEDLVSRPEGYLQLMAQDLLRENFTAYMDQRGGRLRTIPIDEVPRHLSLNLLPNLGKLLTDLADHYHLNPTEWTQFLADAEVHGLRVPDDLQREALPFTLEPDQSTLQRSEDVLAWLKKFNRTYLSPQNLRADVPYGQLVLPHAESVNFFHIDSRSEQEFVLTGAGVNETVSITNHYGAISSGSKEAVKSGFVLGISKNDADIKENRDTFLSLLEKLRSTNVPVPEAKENALRWFDFILGTDKDLETYARLYENNEWLAGVTDIAFLRLSLLAHRKSPEISAIDAFARHFVQPNSPADKLQDQFKENPDVSAGSLLYSLFTSLNNVSIAESPWMLIVNTVWQFEARRMRGELLAPAPAVAAFFFSLAQSVQPGFAVTMEEFLDPATAPQAVRHFSDLLLHPDMTIDRLRAAADHVRQESFYAWVSLFENTIMLHEQSMRGAA